MEDAIKRTVKTIINNIRHGKYIENYVITALALVLALLTTVDVATPQLQQSVVLAALALLVYNLTTTSPRTAVPLTLDHFLHDRSDFIPFADLIKDAKTLWIYAPSGISVLSDMHMRLIQQKILSRPDGEFRIMIQDPQETEAIKILVNHIDKNVKFPLQDMPDALRRATSILEKLDSWPKEGRFEYRYLPFNPGFSLVVVDPYQKDGRAIVEFYGFSHDYVTSRMHLQITRADSDRWFSYWVEQFPDMWEAARIPNPPPSDPTA